MTDLAQRLEEMQSERSVLQEFVRTVLQEGTDYGTIPGTPNPSLYKPGAEMLLSLYGFAAYPAVVQQEIDWQVGLIHYQVEATIKTLDTGSLVGSSLGEANSFEPRYRWRNSKPKCPDCERDDTLLRSKDKPEWFCWRKKGGCGATFPLDAILPGGKVENPEPYELVNTILKQATKRAVVAATLQACHASAIFTQDVEDMPSLGGGQEPPVERAPRPTPAPTPKPAPSNPPQNEKSEPVQAPVSTSSPILVSMDLPPLYEIPEPQWGKVLNEWRVKLRTDAVAAGKRVPAKAGVTDITNTIMEVVEGDIDAAQSVLEFLIGKRSGRELFQGEADVLWAVLCVPVFDRMSEAGLERYEQIEVLINSINLLLNSDVGHMVIPATKEELE